jgi:predicted RNA-binding protein with RPS1 domain
LSSEGKMAIDIDDLNNINNNVVLDKQEGNSAKRFSDSLSEVEKETGRKNNKPIRNQNSQEVDDLMATIPPDIAEKFKDLKDTLEMMETKKSDNTKP